MTSQILFSFMNPQRTPAKAETLRAIINEGASLPSQGTEMLILAAWGVIPFAIALRWFKWQ